jgi:DNA invertase Pin-like site-specific DNA recombinase
MRVAIYARVSTKDKGQDTDNQALQLREYCARHGWEIADEYADRATGKNSDRDEFQRLFEDASRRKFDVVLVWALDRFTREGVHKTFGHIERLSGYGVAFESYTEPHFRTTGPAGELMLAVAAWIAKMDRVRLSERTKAGLEKARRQGRIGGRRKTVFDRARAAAMREAGHSWREIAAELRVPATTVVRQLSQTA